MIVASTWLGSTPEGRAIGCVLVKDDYTNELKGFIGTGHDVGITSCENGEWTTEEENDAMLIAEMGQRTSLEVLTAMFGNLERF